MIQPTHAEPTVSLSDKFNSETARINWHELQSHFARGCVIFVDKNLDIIEVARQMAADNTLYIAPLVAQKKVGLVSDAQAQTWFADNRQLWALVLAPWILVQEA